MERIIGPRKIIAARRTSFQQERRPWPQIFARGLQARVAANEPLEGYEDLLPRVNNKTISQAIEEKTRTGKTVRILDIGCGNGRFLIDCKLRWGDKVDCVGITAFPYQGLHLADLYGPMETHEQATKKELARLDIKVLIGDAHSITGSGEDSDLKKFKPGSFDVVTAVRVAQYLADPMAMIKGIYKVLGIDGIAFINAMPSLFIRNIDFFDCLYYLERNYEFIFENQNGLINTAFTKKKNRLTLPLSYINTEVIDINGRDKPPLEMAVYQFDRSKLRTMERLLHTWRWVTRDIPFIPKII